MLCACFARPVTAGPDEVRRSLPDRSQSSQLHDGYRVALIFGPTGPAHHGGQGSLEMAAIWPGRWALAQITGWSCLSATSQAADSATALAAN
jgi:hypothetical protein